MGEWIEHDGKGPPDLPLGTLVLVRHRGGIDWAFPDPWEYWRPDEDDDTNHWAWQTGYECPWDIVAYRIAT